MNALLLSLSRAGAIPGPLYERLHSSTGKIPLLYGLPKIHKPEIPLRPIVSFVNSPTYQSSKHLVSILTPLVGKSDSHMRNSELFSTFIAGQVLPSGTVLVSFDVISLFTNVPAGLAVEVAHERLRKDTSLAEHTALSADQVANLRFCLDATFLAYRGEHYQQTFGTAMGSPVSITAANLVMEDVERRALSTYPLPLPFWKRYVDDTLTALPQDKVHCFHEHLNSIESTIQFTVEMESEGTLPFLDTKIAHHPDGSLSTTVFRKTTHTDKYLDFKSHHPLAHKMAVAHTLFDRAEKICTDFRDSEKEKEHVTEVLQNNGYPRRLVVKNWRPQPRPQLPEQDPPTATVTLPYIRHLSETIRRILAPLGVRTFFRPHRTLQQTLVRLKDCTPLQQQAGMVYCIPCGSCPRVYIGQTGRTMEHRLKEHKRALTSGNIAQSAIAEHAVDRMHKINRKEAAVVDSHPHYRQRCVPEAWHIRTEHQTMNRDGGPLPAGYNSLIHNRRPAAV